MWLGIVIFERNTRRVIVTADGRSVVGQARRVLAEARLLFTIVQRSGKSFGGMLRLAAISTLGPYLFPSLRRNDAALTSAGIFSEPFLLACPKGHPASRKGGPAWHSLDAEQRLMLEEGHCLREHALVGCSTPGRTNRLATSLETLQYMVAAGEGRTLVPAWPYPSVMPLYIRGCGARPLRVRWDLPGAKATRARRSFWRYRTS